MKIEWQRDIEAAEEAEISLSFFFFCKHEEVA
jgi:hypothetical protein